MANKIAQNPTEKTDVNSQTGLTPIQEQAAIMLASGKSMTEVAELLSVNRGTLYEWQKIVTFQCYFNQQSNEYKENLRNGLFGLIGEALTAISDCLHSDNETTRLKAAMWVIEKAKEQPTGNTDVKAALKEQCTHPVGWDMEMFDEDEYRREIKRLGLVI